MHPQHTEQLRKLRVLVVDDDQALSAVLARALIDAGLEVTLARDGAEGLALAAERPAVVLLDLMMPVLDGYGFIDAFRRTPGCADVPIILASDSESLATARRRIEGKGVVLLMPKPFDLDILLTAIAGAARSHRSATG